MKKLLPYLLLGTAMGLACSEREATKDEPDRAALCSSHCAQVFGPCNPSAPVEGGPQTEAECNSNCVDDDAWEGECRFKYATSLECTTSLSCDEFRSYQLDQINSNPCLEQEIAWSSCL